MPLTSLETTILPSFAALCGAGATREVERKNPFDYSSSCNNQVSQDLRVTMPDTKPLILFIDAYDSFSNNITSVLESELDCRVRVVKIDNPVLLSSDAALHKELSHYAAVVCGPGPGHPEKSQDVGIMNRIWKLGQDQILPVLGICLGFQSLCLEFGGEVKRLKGPQHGMIRHVVHAGEFKEGNETVFSGVGEVKATLYQSLCVNIGQDSEAKETWETNKWKPTRLCPDLIPLAWVESDRVEGCSGIMDDRVLVAVRHRTKPFWALQYHPESICTNDESKKVIFNWFEQAQRWNCLFRSTSICLETPPNGELVVRESLLRQSEISSRVNSSNQSSISSEESLLSGFSTDYKYRSRMICLPEFVTVPDIVEAVQEMRGSQNHITLESSNSHERSLGSTDMRNTHSIIGLDVDDCLRFEYTTEDEHVTVIDPHLQSRALPQCKIDLRSFGGIWEFLARFLDKRRMVNGEKDSSFWGGFMGYTTYEMGLEGIGVKSNARKHHNHVRPDLCFAWVTRSLVIDHQKSLIYIQELAHDPDQGQDWMDSIIQKIQALSLPVSGILLPYVSSSHPLFASRNSSQTSLSLSSSGLQTPLTEFSKNSTQNQESLKPHLDSIASIKIPSSQEYECKVRSCQEYIRAGDSYELCLTDQTVVRRQRFDPSHEWATSDSPNKNTPNSGPDSWHLYRTLRARQPAPFGSYIRLGAATFISCSPERFLTYSRSGKCELRPMKGTVRKSPSVPTLADAIPLLDVPKEKAENLMIVDLVRHDLFSICGSGNVRVPRLMVVEEYRSVFTMISIVEGQIPEVAGDEQMYTGLDVLAASLPPGSMTGAPKKRSCEILQNLEGKERSLYSGVVGYMDVGGRGDWSVNIRCMFRWDDEDEVLEDGKTIESWHIGAGGAVTILSTAEGEREEMLTKLNGTLGVFT